MENITKEILPGSGLAELMFGATREDVQSKLGEPDEIEQYSDEDTDELINEAWHYDSMELSLSFDKEENWRLSTISVSDQTFTLGGAQVIGLMKEDLTALLEAQNLTPFEEEEWSMEDEDEVQQLVTLPEKSMNFWFTAGKVSEMQWGPFYNEADETIWPN